MSTQLRDSPGDIIAQLLIDLGLGTAPAAGAAWPVYSEDEPDGPDNCLTVYTTTGTDDGRSHADGEIQQHSGFQVRCRSKDHATGWAKMDEIQTTLAQDITLRNVTVGSNSYLVYGIVRFGDILCIGKDAPRSHRRLFTLNAFFTTK